MHSNVEYTIKFSVQHITQFLTMHNEILRNFKVRRISGNRVFLDRIRPSMCIKCDRVHMRENAMICLKVRKGGASHLRDSEYNLVCWRSYN